MTAANRGGVSAAEVQKRKREGTIIAVSLLLIVTLTVTEVHLSRLSLAVPLGNKIFIFGDP